MDKGIKKILDGWRDLVLHEYWEASQVNEAKQEYRKIINYIQELESPKWHKVADGDLPKRSGRYLCVSKYGKTKNYNIYFYNTGKSDTSAEIGFNDFDFERGDWILATGVIAWCEAEWC